MGLTAQNMIFNSLQNFLDSVAVYLRKCKPCRMRCTQRLCSCGDCSGPHLNCLHHNDRFACARVSGENNHCGKAPTSGLLCDRPFGIHYNSFHKRFLVLFKLCYKMCMFGCSRCAAWLFHIAIFGCSWLLVYLDERKYTTQFRKYTIRF